jgi:ribosomal protein S18 acetylase RimI-like enzyme
VKVRRATEADEAVLRALWTEFEAEAPSPPGFLDEPWEVEWRDAHHDLDAGGVFVAEDDGDVVASARLTLADHGAAHLHLVHVRPHARRRGVAKALLAACLEHAREHDRTMVTLHVLTTNELARTVWRRLGFEDVSYLMATRVEALEARLAVADHGEHRATIHVQTDDELSVERALAQFIPRLQAPDVRATTNGWIRIADVTTDRDRDAQGRLARELSERLGAVTVALALEGPVVRFRLYERGRMVDEYLSVPTYYGPLPKGDELALAANPTLVARLTGADREQVRSVARTALSPADLPPAAEHFERLARLMGL